MRRNGSTALFVIAVMVGLSATRMGRAEENWPQWRGPRLRGDSDAAGLPDSWSDTRNIIWKAALPSWAGSTPVIWGDCVFLTSPSRAAEGGDNGRIGRRLKSMPVNVSEPGGKDLLLFCIDKGDGHVRWRKPLAEGNKFYAKHNMASPSPVTDGRHVWVVTGTGRVAAFDFKGAEVWSRDLQREFGEFGLYWGYASSPLLCDPLLIAQVLHGSTNKAPSYLIAFDKQTGETVWKVERRTDALGECPDAYTTPTVLKQGDQTLLIVAGADCVTANDLKDGAEVWRAGGLNPEKQKNFRIVGSPTVVGDRVIGSSRERPVVEIRGGGRGDVTKTHTVWTYSGRKGPDVPSIATDGTLLYLLHDNGFVTCLEAETGKEVWGPERIEHGPYSASPLVAEGRVYVTNEEAVTTVLAAGREFRKLQVNRLSGGYTLSSFAVSGNRLFLRTADALFCIGQK